jgi:hypothetical protein
MSSPSRPKSGSLAKCLKQLQPALLLYLYVEALSLLCVAGAGKLLHIHYDPTLSPFSKKQKAVIADFIARECTLLHPTLGWRWLSISDAVVNSDGTRDDHEYQTVPPTGVLRISAFGDSFTFGLESGLPETWEKQIASMAPSVEVLNYGVGTYGLDQAYLRCTELGLIITPTSL